MIESTLNPNIQRFVDKYCRDDILALSTIYPDSKSLQIDFTDLERADRDLAEFLIKAPDPIIAVFQRQIKDFPIPGNVILKNVTPRFSHVPNRIPIRDLRSKDISNLVSVEGIIRRATEVRPKVTKAAFRCLRCDYVTYVEQFGNRMDEPYAGCENENCGKRGPFKFVPDLSAFIDAQKAQIQELPESLKGGSNPQSIEIDFSEDLAGQIFPGDRVIINGILRSVQKPVREGKSTYYDLIIEANSIERLDQEFSDFDISDEDEAKILELSKNPEIYNKIVNSIAPAIFGHTDVKKALMYQLFSGVVKQHNDGTRVRGDIHVILIGDPGVAKSQMLRYIVKLSPRGVFASGKSASASGLTAAAVRDELGDGRWTIEGGALVMADMGIAAIDEMDKMRDDDKSALHEAMEQQTISIAKAGIIATLKSRCALLGAANPVHGRFNIYESLADQIDMPPALLSRFDLIFVLLDKPNLEHDERIARHVAKSHYAGELVQHKKTVRFSEYDSDFIDSQVDLIEPEIDLDLLRKYIAYAKKCISPVMDETAKERLVKFYQELRNLNSGKNAPVPATARQLEALIRIAEASARVRLSNKIEIDDAERAIEITMDCLKAVGVDPQTGQMDVDIIEAGMSKSQRDKIEMIKEIIRDVAMRDVNAKAQITDVITKAIGVGIEEEEIEVLIEKLSLRGEIIRPNKDCIKMISR